jgi:hypothetical protein
MRGSENRLMPVDTRLLSYIKEEFGKGFSQQQVRLALTSSGYDPAQVDAAFAQLSSDSDGAQSLAQSLARNGVQAPQAQEQLTRSGYSSAVAARAVRTVYGAPASSALESSHTLVFALLALLVGAGGMWLFLGSGDSGELAATPAADAVSFAPSEIIAQVLEVARARGAEAGVRACGERLSGRDRDLCILDVAILPETQDIALCDRIADIQYADACYMNFLGDADNADAVCAKVRLAQNRDTCDAIMRLRPSGAAA